MILNTKKLYQFLIDWIKDLIKSFPDINGFITNLRYDNPSILVLLLLHDANLGNHKIPIKVFTESNEIKNLCEILSIDTIDLEVDRIISNIKFVPNIDVFKDHSEGRKYLSMLDWSNINNYLIVGNKTRNEAKFIRSYKKYGNGLYDMNPIQDIFDSEVFQLLDYKYSVCLDLKNKNLEKFLGKCTLHRQIGEFFHSELEWADNLNRHFHIITDDKDPSKHMRWPGLTGRQKEIIAQIHQINKLTRHKEFTHILYPKVRELDSLVKNV